MECLNHFDIEPLVAPHANVMKVRFLVPTFPSLIQTCATHGWLPNAASAPAITLLRQLVQLWIITKDTRENQITQSLSNVSLPSDSPSSTSSSSSDSKKSARSLVSINDEANISEILFYKSPSSSHIISRRSVSVLLTSNIGKDLFPQSTDSPQSQIPRPLTLSSVRSTVGSTLNQFRRTVESEK